jgi:hypothetical protein
MGDRKGKRNGRERRNLVDTEQAPHFPPWRFVAAPLVRGGLARILDAHDSPVMFVPSPGRKKTQQDAEWIARAPDRENVYRTVAFQVGTFRDFLEDVADFLGENYHVADREAVELHERALNLLAYKRIEERLLEIESARVRR